MLRNYYRHKRICNESFKSDGCYHAVFISTLFQDCEFLNCSFVECSFFRCEFRRCTFQNVNHTKCIVSSLALVDSLLAGWSTYKSILNDFTLRGTHLSHSVMVETKIHHGYGAFNYVTFVECDITDMGGSYYDCEFKRTAIPKGNLLGSKLIW